MPWDCKISGCHGSQINDDISTCPECGEEKASWTMVPDSTRVMNELLS